MTPSAPSPAASAPLVRPSRSRGPLLTAVALALALPFLIGQSPQLRTNAPVKDFSLPVFNPAGFRTLLLRGTEGTRLSADEASLKEMTLTVFSGDEAARVENMLLSPNARVLLEKHVVFGDGAVRLIGDNFELTGTHWRYDHENKTFEAKDARVVFQTELKDILK